MATSNYIRVCLTFKIVLCIYAFLFLLSSTIFNSVIPIVVKILMLFERHQTEGGFQSSLYLKITLFRWVNTAIALQVCRSTLLDIAVCHFFRLGLTDRDSF